jgi:hypothetical protein
MQQLLEEILIHFQDTLNILVAMHSLLAILSPAEKNTRALARSSSLVANVHNAGHNVEASTTQITKTVMRSLMKSSFAEETFMELQQRLAEFLEEDDDVTLDSINAVFDALHVKFDRSNAEKADYTQCLFEFAGICAQWLA